MTGPWSSRLVLRDPTVDAAVLETRPRRHRPLRPRLAQVQRRGGAQRRRRPPGAGRHRGHRGPRQGQADHRRGRRGLLRAQRRRRAGGGDGRREPGRADLGHHGSHERARAGARPRQGQGRGAGGGAERPDDRPLRRASGRSRCSGRARSRRPSRGRRCTTSRTPCSPPRSPTAWGSAREHPAGAAHLHHRFLPGPGAAQLLQRASVPGAARLRPQRPRHGRHGADRARARRPRPAHRRDRRPRRPPRRGHPRLGRRPRRPPSTHPVREDDDLRGREPGEVAALLPPGAARGRRPGRADRPRGLPRRRTPSCAPSRWPAPATSWSSSATSSPASGSRSSTSSPSRPR